MLCGFVQRFDIQLGASTRYILSDVRKNGKTVAASQRTTVEPHYSILNIVYLATISLSPANEVRSVRVLWYLIGSFSDSLTVLYVPLVNSRKQVARWTGNYCRIMQPGKDNSLHRKTAIANKWPNWSLTIPLNHEDLETAFIFLDFVLLHMWYILPVHERIFYFRNYYVLQ